MVEGVEYFYVVYAGIWLGLIFYLIYLHSKNIELRRRLDHLKDMVNPHGSKSEDNQKKPKS